MNDEDLFCSTEDEIEKDKNFIDDKDYVVKKKRGRPKGSKNKVSKIKIKKRFGDKHYTAVRLKKYQKRTSYDDFDPVDKPKRALLISSLPEDTTESDLKSYDSNMINVKFLPKHQTNNKKQVLVEFKSISKSIQCKDRMDAGKFKDVYVHAQYISPHTLYAQVQNNFIPVTDHTKLFVTGFGRDATISQLQTLFSTANYIDLVLDPETKKPYGYAFIIYSDESSARQAHNTMQDFLYEGRALVVMFGKKTSPEMEQIVKEERSKAKNDDPSREDSASDDDDDEDLESDDDEGPVITKQLENKSQKRIESPKYENNPPDNFTSPLEAHLLQENKEAEVMKERNVSDNEKDTSDTDSSEEDESENSNDENTKGEEIEIRGDFYTEDSELVISEKHRQLNEHSDNISINNVGKVKLKPNVLKQFNEMNDNLSQSMDMHRQIIDKDTKISAVGEADRNHNELDSKAQDVCVKYKPDNINSICSQANDISNKNLDFFSRTINKKTEINENNSNLTKINYNFNNDGLNNTNLNSYKSEDNLIGEPETALDLRDTFANIYDSDTNISIKSPNGQLIPNMYNTSIKHTTTDINSMNQSVLNLYNPVSSHNDMHGDLIPNSKVDDETQLISGREFINRPFIQEMLYSQFGFSEMTPPQNSFADNQNGTLDTFPNLTESTSTNHNTQNDFNASQFDPNMYFFNSSLNDKNDQF